MELLEKFKEFTRKYYKEILIIIFCGVLIHLYALTNKLLNWDEIHCLFRRGGTFRLGRWGFAFMKYVFPDFSMPVYNGILGIIFVSISAIIISEIFEIKSKINRIIIGIIMVAYPVLTCTMSYMFAVHCYMFSMLLAVMSAYFSQKIEKKYIIISIIFLVASLSIYQAYISITATLMIIILIKNLFKTSDIKNNFKLAIKFFAILVVSIIIYWVINKICLYIMQIELSDYQGLSEVGIPTLKEFIYGIILSYKTMIIPIVSTKKMMLIHIFVILVDVILGIKNLWFNKKNIQKSLFLLIYYCVLPIAMNMMCIIKKDHSLHSLMLYGNVVPYIILIMFIDRKELKNKYIDIILKLSVIFQIFIFATLANESYLELQLAYDNVYSFYQGIITNITNTAGFDEESKIVIVGEYDNQYVFEQFNELSYFTGIATNKELINSYSKERFIKYYLGFNQDFVYEEDVKDELIDNEQFKSMNCYPYNGSIKKNR